MIAELYTSAFCGPCHATRTVLAEAARLGFRRALVPAHTSSALPARIGDLQVREVGHVSDLLEVAGVNGALRAERGRRQSSLASGQEPPRRSSEREALRVVSGDESRFDNPEVTGTSWP